MSVDYTKIQLFSDMSSNKILAQGTGTFSVPALGGIGSTFGSATIAHGGTDDNLIFQVTTSGGPTNGVIVPWASNDGRILQYAKVDSTNLYIYVISTDASGLGASAFTVSYTYRVLVP